MKVGIAQFSMSNELLDNQNKAINVIEKLSDKGAELIILPELFATPYFCQEEDPKNFAYAETIPGNFTDQLSEIAKKRNICIVASLFEKSEPSIFFNTIAFISPLGLLGKYRKTHIPDDPKYYEKFYFAPGNLGYKVFPCKDELIGTLICWDQWFPEAARITALLGAKVLVYPTAIGWHPEEKDEFGSKQLQAWLNVQRGHAIANGAFVVTVNRIGFESNSSGDGIEFWGNSFVVNPYGEILHQSKSDTEDNIVIDLDLTILEEFRSGWPFFRDRRVDLYSEILKLSSD